MNILHITDLHIDNFDAGSKELLRKANYKSYLHELLEISEQHNVDTIVVTGDLINTSKVKNIEYVIQIISYIVDSLKIKKERVFVVNGNHDIPRNDGSLEAFKDMERALTNYKGRVLQESERYKIVEVDVHTCALVMDSIGSSFENGKPSDLPSVDFDSIIEKIEERSFKYVLVASHHPPESFSGHNQALLDEGESFSSHIWPHGGHLRRKLGHPSSSVEKMVWFSGDTHRAEHAVVDTKSALINTGSLNHVMRENREDKPRDALPPQARILSFDNIETSTLVNYQFHGHNRVQGEGEWKSTSSSVAKHDNKSTAPKGNNTSQSKSKICNNRDNSDAQKKTLVSSDTPQSNIKLLSEDLNNEIKNYIDQNKLCKQGVYGSHDTKSLNWVSVTALLSKREIFRKVVSVFKDALDSIIEKDSIEKDEIILVGVDNWGAIIAHRLGAGTNIKCCNIGVSDNEESYLPEEKINRNLRSIIEKKKLALFVTDIIASGNTLESIHNLIKVVGCDYKCMTVIFDKDQNRKSDLCFLKEINVLCESIKIPLIDSKYLQN